MSTEDEWPKKMLSGCVCVCVCVCVYVYVCTHDALLLSHKQEWNNAIAAT